MRAINAFDLKTLPTERVEILQRILPNDKEVKAFKDYEAQRKPVDVLADEDKFLYSVSAHLFVRESLLHTMHDMFVHYYVTSHVVFVFAVV